MILPTSLPSPSLLLEERLKALGERTAEVLGITGSLAGENHLISQGTVAKKPYGGTMLEETLPAHSYSAHLYVVATWRLILGWTVRFRSLVMTER